MSDLKEKLNNKDITKVNGGSHHHPGIGHLSSKRPIVDDDNDNWPKTLVCEECETQFVVSQYEYDDLATRYTGYYCMNCRNKHRK